MRKLLALMALLCATVAHSEEIALLSNDDVTSTSYTYCEYSGWRSGVGAKTTGSSTTVTAVSGTPFQSFGVGDEISVIPGSPLTTSPVTRKVTGVASSTSITISGSAVDWSDGYAFQWRHRTCGTAASDGAVSTNLLVDKSIQLCVNTINATSLTFVIEARASRSSTFGALLSATNTTYTAVGCETIPIPDLVTEIRLGVKETGDAGAQSVTATLLLGRY